MNYRRRRRYFRSWSVTDSALVVVIAFVLMIGLLAADEPPTPPGAETINVKLAWDAPLASDVWNSVDTNGVFVPLLYRVHHATNVPSTNWLVLVTTTNHTGGVVVSNLSQATPHFFFITVSNAFLESDPSAMIGLPAPKGKIQGTRILLE